MSHVQTHTFIASLETLPTGRGDILAFREGIHRLDNQIPLINGYSNVQYARVLYLDQKRDQSGFGCCSWAPRAVGLANDMLPAGQGLGVREINRLEANFAIARRWVESCIRDHSVTCADRPTQANPSAAIRLIDCRENILVSRHIHGNHTRFKYLCLSYVWGTEPQNVRLQGNRIIDAFCSSRMQCWWLKSLGQRYLWVDSVS